MVKKGYSVGAAQKQKSTAIQSVVYQPPQAYRLDLEVMSTAELRQRVDREHFRAAQRIGFHLLLYITHGHCTHTIDFHPVACGPGSLLLLRPGQAQQYDMDQDWEGWLVIFQPEFLLPFQATASLPDLQMVGRLEGLPVVLTLEEAESAAVEASILQMQQDARLTASASALHDLLRHQLSALLARLDIANDQRESCGTAAPLNLQRFKRFRHLVEKQFATWHQVADYANQLGLSEKSLTRASLDVAGVSAKQYIMDRVSLEAKRLLVHTSLSILVIAEQIGFDEATNFVKFFKREAGCSPGEFRRRRSDHADAEADTGDERQPLKRSA